MTITTTGLSLGDSQLRGLATSKASAWRLHNRWARLFEDYQLPVLVISDG